MSIEEGNKIIAEFMGGGYTDYPDNLFSGQKGYHFPIKIGNSDWWNIDSLRFHTSWDWLMPVVVKFEEANDCFFDWDKSAYDENTKLSIKCVWETMVEAIHQFNSTKAEQ